MRKELRKKEIAVEVLTEYVRAAMHQARYELLQDGSFYVEIAELKGVWANAETLEKSREVLEEWILLRLSKNLPIPAIEGISIESPSLT